MHESMHVGPFTLQALLGDSARSRVWRAHDRRDGSVRALKLAPLDDAPACARLRNEWALAPALSHPHLLGIVAAGEDAAAGAAWLAMECLHGARAALTPSTFRQLLLALAHLHANGIVHGDVKPANLLAARDGSAVLADFGIACKTGQGGARGTPRYMAPEQWRGQSLDGRADLFAAGAVLFELVAGGPVFAGTPFEVMQQILRGAVPATGTPYDALLRRALAPAARERFPSAAEFLASFDAICQL